MISQHQKYYGEDIKSINTENFNISLTSHNPNFHIPKHTHHKPYLCLLVRGSYVEDSKTQTILSAGNIIFRRANYEHSNKFYNNRGICLNIEINDSEDFKILNDGNNSMFERKQKGTVDIYNLLYAFKNDIPSDVLNIYCFESILSYFDKHNVQKNLSWIIKVKEFLNDDPFSNISLNKLSKEIQLHPNYIVRKFKEVTGYKLSEYLSRIRIEYAIQKLLQSEESITDIALNTGFYDQSHFNHNFKKYFPISPKPFLNRIKG